MKRLSFILLIVALLANVPKGLASRLSEVEDYYTKKVTTLISTRFPNKPFVVFVKAETGKNEVRSRQKSTSRGNAPKTQLPYLDMDEETEIDFWSRTDLPLGTLIGQLKRVEIKIQIDAALEEKELEIFKQQVASQLKLVAGIDLVEISRMKWSATPESRMRRFVLYSLFGGSILMLFVFWLISRLSIKSLVSGLSRPLNDLNKANSPQSKMALEMAADATIVGSSKDGIEEESEDPVDDILKMSSNLLEIRNSALELLERNMELLKSPDAEVLFFLESQGSEYPSHVGAILAELDENVLRELFKYGKGQWWYVALSQPTAMTPVSLKILNELDRLRLRRHFTAEHHSELPEDIKKAGLILGRLKFEQLQEIFGNVSMEEVDPILALLPRNFQLAVCKRLYPGKWASLLDPTREINPINTALLKTLLSMSLKAFPLREEKEIRDFFVELDLVRYLDSATPRDEKEIYQALPKSSRIIAERPSFFRIFEATEEIKKLMAPELTIVEWTTVLFDCDETEKQLFFASFSEKQAFLVKERIKNMREGGKTIDALKMRRARLKAVQVYMKHIEQTQENEVADITEAKNAA